VLQWPWGLLRRLRVEVVADDNSTTALRQRPFHLGVFWRRYCYNQSYRNIYLMVYCKLDKFYGLLKLLFRHVDIACFDMIKSY